MKLPRPARESHFLSQSHVLGPLLLQRTLAPKPTSHLLPSQRLFQSPFLAPPASSSLFWMSPFLGTSCTHQRDPSPPVVQPGSNAETWQLDGVSAPNDPCRQLTSLLCGPLCNLSKTTVLASSRSQRNAGAAQISPDVNILTREKKKGGGFSISFREIWWRLQGFRDRSWDQAVERCILVLALAATVGKLMERGEAEPKETSVWVSNWRIYTFFSPPAI